MPLAAFATQHRHTPLPGRGLGCYAQRMKARMNARLIVSQGRLADRTPGAPAGAALVGAALAERLGTLPRFVGAPEAPRTDEVEAALAHGAPTLHALGSEVTAALRAGAVPVIAGNKCPVALASLPAAAAAYPDLVVAWFDAHGDLNTPANSATGYLGGMVLAAACGLWRSGHGAGVDPANVVLVGARDLDPAEAELVAKHDVTVFTAAEAEPDRLRRFVAGRPLWVHLDLDVLEPGHVPLDYEVPGGLTPTGLRACLAALAGEQLVGLEVTEFEAPAAYAESWRLAPHWPPPEPDTATAAAVATVVRALEPLLAPLAPSLLAAAP